MPQDGATMGKKNMVFTMDFVYFGFSDVFRITFVVKLMSIHVNLL